MRQGPRSVWPAWLALLAYAALLVFLASERPAEAPRGGPGWPQVTRDPAVFLKDHILAGLGDLLRFLPLGFLAVLSMGRRERRLERVLRVWAPGLALAGTLAVAIVGVEVGGPWSQLGLLDLTLPALACGIGAWLGVSWSKGRRARLRILPKLALLAAGLAAAGVALLVLAAEPAALDFEPTEVTAADRRRLYRLFRDKNPAKLPEGRTAELRLTEHDLDQLLAWGLSLGRPGRKAKVELAREQSTLRVSLRFPAGRFTRYLNVTAEGEAGIEQGRVRLRGRRLDLGRIETPAWALELLAPLAARLISSERRAKPLLAPIRTLELEPGALRVSYGRGEPPPGFLADLFHGEGTSAEELPAIRAHLDNLIQAARRLPRDGEARFGSSLEAAFRLARERSKAGDPVRENRAAILALGMLLGHWRVETLVGKVADMRSLQRAVRAYRGTTLRGRDDWPKHFFVSAALAVLAVSSVSDAAGLLKEEVDAGGGSGFSFADLLADRAGATFAATATRDERTARAFQERLARGFRVDDYFPPARDLPEGLQDAEFRARYGGVGGEGYRRLAAEIEQRIQNCAGYRL